MTKIKFRIWNKNKKRMIKRNTLCILCVIEDGRLEKENFEIMQYTGVKDKNGKEIYEGDILKLNDEIAKVIFCEGCFLLDIKDDDNLFAISEDWEVIGNVYENPELLEQEG